MTYDPSMTITSTIPAREGSDSTSSCLLYTSPCP